MALSAGRCADIRNGCIVPQRILYPQLRVGTKGDRGISPNRLGRSSGYYCWPAGGDPAAVRRRVDPALFLCRQYGGGKQICRLPPVPQAGYLAGWIRPSAPLPPEQAGRSSVAIFPAVRRKMPRRHELIVAWGINIKVTNVHFWQYVTAARKKGAKLLVIDPYRNQTGKSADNYLQVKPGGDSALALGVMKSLIERDLVDHEFIDRATTRICATGGLSASKGLGWFCQGERCCQKSTWRSLAPCSPARPGLFSGSA